MKKALLLTYYWPPGSGPGVQRWLKFCKYLVELGWEIEVITVENGSYPSTDSSLLDDVPEDLRVFRTKTIEPFAVYNALRGKSGKQVEVGMSNLKGKPSLFKRISNYVRANFFVPDARVGWNTYAFPMAIKRIKAFQPDLIITTGPPHSTHLMGARLKRMFSLPWVADFRDPWTTIYYNAYLNRTTRTQEKDKSLEDQVLKTADGIVVASTGMQEEFEARTQRITFIPNGFDPKDFEQTVTEIPEKMRLAYVGNLKSNQNIYGFWLALSSLSPEQRSSVELEITGNMAADVKESIASYALEDLIKVKAFVPHREAIERMLNAHVLLLPIPQSENNKSILTGKLFEYLATRRPILAIGPTGGNAADILRDVEKADMIDYKDVQAITQRFDQLLNTFSEKQGQHWTSGNDAYLKYSRKETAKTLSEFMQELVP